MLIPLRALIVNALRTVAQAPRPIALRGGRSPTADYLLVLKGNHSTLEDEVADYFNSAPAQELVVKDAEIEKGHGRIEMRTYTASSNADWIISTRSYPVSRASPT